MGALRIQWRIDAIWHRLVVTVCGNVANCPLFVIKLEDLLHDFLDGCPHDSREQGESGLRRL